MEPKFEGGDNLDKKDKIGKRTLGRAVRNEIFAQDTVGVFEVAQPS